MSTASAVPGQPVAAACVHFGTCGGCQLQTTAYADQLALKHERLLAQLSDAGIRNVPAVQTHSAEPYGYRNRIRLQVRRSAAGSGFQLGYNRRGTTEFLPITMCPIAAPVLWQVAEAIVAAAAADERGAGYWLAAASELELFCDDAASMLQVTFFCAPRTKAPGTGQTAAFDTVFATLQRHMPDGITLAGAGVEAFDPRTGPTGRSIASAGSPGLSYAVAVGASNETYWITRGGFFQVNRFLIATLVRLVCEGLEGKLAWDLYAGVGLFSRILARSFAAVTAVEANSSAVADLRAHFKRSGSAHTAVESTTFAFLERAVTQRERPELVVLDPPRAGAGIEACSLLLRLQAPTIVYVSCDPVTLARDLAVLQSDYKISALHGVDLFPQTTHQETVAILTRIG